MKILFLLIPLSLIMIVIAVFAFRWAIKNRQFDDMTSPAMMPLLDDTEEERARFAQAAAEKAVKQKSSD
ncbi:cbb3-type cytochrome oxidase assembly protein CcoS [Suttonella ornithocola]|uniref:Uncharacterized protein, possibly involved in nitrogen fixation n=1 Tax=Suttonella ornithocola TaxID=279832 RepID=A0A380MZ60_9GAMM|nr:cbb3-type cytochrome oxidase assembly protein CcoS [Suttonella ornithocola]SUO97568.1 Uncharacterized protein, possibly involved in nitrogen fixation [Suttonella ornithocola]